MQTGKDQITKVLGGGGKLPNGLIIYPKLPIC